MTDSGTLSFTDVDVGDAHTITSAYNGDAVWSGGTLSPAQVTAITAGFTAGGAGWNYTIANTALQFLGAGETITLSFAVTVTDNSGASNNSDTETVSLTLTGADDANDAPVLTPDIPEGVTYTENTGAVQLLSDGAIADPDNPVDFAGGSINVTISGAVAGDRLSLLTGENVQLTRSTDGLSVTVAGVAVGTISGFATANMTIALNPGATDAAVETLLHALVFNSHLRKPDERRARRDHHLQRRWRCGVGRGVVG